VSADALGATPGIGGAPTATATIGVRPEDIQLGREPGVAAEVLAVEHLGVETVLLLAVQGQKLHALLGAGTPLAAGARTSVSVRPGAALFFDEAGRRLAGSCAPAPAMARA